MMQNILDFAKSKVHELEPFYSEFIVDANGDGWTYLVKMSDGSSGTYTPIIANDINTTTTTRKRRPIRLSVLLEESREEEEEDQNINTKTWWETLRGCFKPQRAIDNN